jgi:predicted GH43/DUF377 family glycosyl hydrolase
LSVSSDAKIFKVLIVLIIMKKQLRRRLATCLVFCLIFGLVVVFILEQSVKLQARPRATNNWYDTDWGYRKAITVDNMDNENNLINYQVQVSLIYDSAMQADFGDVRFTDSDGATLIDHWLETKIDTTSAIFWVEIPNIPASSNKTIYVYYGNAGASSSSNGNDAFDIVTSVEDWRWTNLSKYGNNPILGPTNGSWEGGWFVAGDVEKIGDTFYLYYEGGGKSSRKIGLATSSDGINWTKYGSDPVLREGNPGDWDELFVTDADVLKVGSTWYMYYSGLDGPRERLGLATSTDGINWTKYENNPILEAEGNIWQPSVLKVGDTWYMWYGTHNHEINLATSSDGMNWTNSENNPVLRHGSFGEWDNYSSFGCHVLLINGTYHMVYTGRSLRESRRYRIGYAQSSDGVNWTKYRSNPIINWGDNEEWDDYKVSVPILYQTGTNTFNIYYSGHNGTDYIGVGLAQGILNYTTFMERISLFDDFEDGSTYNSNEDLWYFAYSNYTSSNQSKNGGYSGCFPKNIRFTQSQSLGSLKLGAYILTQWIYFDDTSGRRTTIGILDSDGSDPLIDAGSNCKFENGDIFCYNGNSYVDTTLDFRSGWNKVEIIQKAYVFDIRVNNGSWRTNMANRNIISNIDRFGVASTADTYQSHFDDFLVRKYSSPEPSVSVDSKVFSFIILPNGKGIHVVPSGSKWIIKKEKVKK